VSSTPFIHLGKNRLASYGDLLGQPAQRRAWDGNLGGDLRIAEAAAGGGEERRQKRRQAQKQQHLTITTKDTMKVAPAMLNAQPDMEALEMETLWRLPSCVRYWRSDRSG
jgi:hypothetical protein